MTAGRVPCSSCGATAGEPCIDTIDQRIALAPHAARVQRANETSLPASLALVAR